MDRLDPRTTALVLIDLQGGILRFARGPYNGDQVLATAAGLARRFRAAGALVVLVRVGFSDGLPELLRQPTDEPAPIDDTLPLPEGWWDQPAQLEVAPTDIQITKRNWGAFHGTELDLQLRRRKIETIILTGIATNFGVEQTGREAWQHGYTVLFAEDAMSAVSEPMHRFAVDNIFPRLGRTRSTAAIVANA